ncbi:MAG: FAD:protein FMN transferase [Acidimicrobiales bacterium]
MGTDCHIVVVGPRAEALATFAMAEVERLEQLWSRFLPNSEISRINAGDGRPAKVSSETLAMVERAMLARRLTEGGFDPLMGTNIVELGYVHPMQSQRPEAAAARTSQTALERSAGRSGGTELQIDRLESSVAVAAEVDFDPGGIGKGFAADLVSQTTIEGGAWGVLVNLGGDLRVRGTPPSDDAWTIQIAEPSVSSETIATVRLTDGAVATSTTMRRRWHNGERDCHHLLDPRTGTSTIAGPSLVSVIAGDGWWAEAAATALCSRADSDEIAIPQPDGCAALVVGADGTVGRVGGFESFEVRTFEVQPEPKTLETLTR